MSLSSITFSGTLKKDPEKRFTPTNIPVTNLLVEVCYIPRTSQQVNGGISSQVIRVNAWRDLAEECEKKLKTGDKILIVGRAQINAYTSSEGKKKRELEVDASSITLINDVLVVKAPLKQEEKEGSKSFSKKLEKDVEQVSNIEEMVANTEEIPF